MNWVDCTINDKLDRRFSFAKPLHEVMMDPPLDDTTSIVKVDNITARERPRVSRSWSVQRLRR